MDSVHSERTRFSPAADTSEMRERIAAFDWSSTALGPIESWPQALRGALSICLESSFPIVLYGGPEFVVLYNDACSGFAGDRHPWVLGQPAQKAWFDLWDIIGPDFERASAGRATRRQAQLLPINRHGYIEECYFNYTLSAIRGAGNQVEGLFGTIAEATGQVVGERRLLTLRDLAVAPGGQVVTVELACESAAGVLAENSHDLPFALLYLLDTDQRHVTLAGSAGVERGASISSVVVDLDEPNAPWPFDQVLQTQRRVEVQELSKRFGPLIMQPWPETIEQGVVLPITKPGQAQLAGFVVAGVSPRRWFDDDYAGFFDLIAGQIATSVSNARAFEEERHRAEALADLDRAKTNFFNNISHEFRTPLTLMLSPVEDLLAKPQGEVRSENRELLTVVNRNGRRLLRLVNTLLDFSRIEAGRAVAMYQPTALAAFTRDLCSVFRSACERARLRLVIDCPTLAEPVYIDREMWEKIVLNLLSNAFKYTFEGEIAVALRQIDQTVQLRVGDMGTGISAEEMPHLFERFHRIDNAHGRTHEGSGIGLALVRELVKLHGGSITADSLVGRGSTFTVTIPLGSAHLPPERIRETPTAASTTTGPESYAEESLRWLPDAPDSANGLAVGDLHLAAAAAEEPVSEVRSESLARVLIADDNTDLRQYLVRLLSGQYEVLAVSNGEQALDAARQWKPELVLADVMMPRLDGFGLLRELRADPATSGLPIIMLSARAGEDSRLEGLEAGADDYLIKPFSGRELLARVGGALQIARLRRESRVSLRQGEQRLTMALRAGRMVAWEWDLATDTIMLSENAAELFGLPEDACTQSSEQRFALLHGEDAEQHRAIVSQAVQDCVCYRSQFRMIRRDNGAIIWLEERGDSVCDAAGKVVRLVGVAMDITERKQIEQTLQGSHARFEALVSNAPVGICLVDANMRIRQLNPKARPVFGDLEGLVGDDFSKIIHNVWSQEYADEVIAMIEHTLRTGEPRLVPEYIEQRPGRGASKYYEWQIHHISLPDGQHGVVCYFSDVSRHVLAQQALAENDRRKDEFLATLAHELRNPLAPIRTGLELIRMAGEDRAMVQDVRRKMEGQTRQLVRLVDDLLDVSRITSGKVVLRKERVDLSHVVQSAVEATWSLIEAAGHELSVSLPSQAITLDGDVTRLAQILSNLLSNAARYTENMGRISLVAQRQGNEVVVTVTDNGIGIPASMLENIFEMFTQVDRSLERSHSGLGIGLTLVKRLVEMHGGSVKADSEGLGKGSVFSIHLPIASEPSPQTPSREDQRIAPLTKLRILIVDDNQDAARMLSTVVEMLGNEARVAFDGLEALEVAAAFHPDVVLMDLGMPKLNGYDAARRLRKLWDGKMKLVAMTGWGQDEDRRRTLDAGFDHHMIKPVEPSDLRDLLAHCQPHAS